MDSSSSVCHSLPVATDAGGKEGFRGTQMAGNDENSLMGGHQEFSSSFVGDAARNLADARLPVARGELGDDGEPSTEMKPPLDPRFGPRSGLAERMLVRAGFNAPKLNTDRILSGNVGSFSSEAQSPFITIPPGLSPTSFLDSPVFLTNSLAQPSPTTGKLELVQTINHGGDSFMFKPHGDFTSNHANSNDNCSSLSSKPPGQPNSPNPESPENLSDSLMGEELPDQQQDGEGENRGDSHLIATSAQSEDGYNWRKYGQKQVKGSEFPRSYYKCTHPNCQVKKKVERSLEGVTTEITYQGIHNHLKPASQSRRLSVGPGLPLLGEAVADGSHPDDHGQGTDGLLIETVGGSDLPSNEDDEDHGAEEDELESKRRKLDLASMEAGGASRAVREPRVVVQTTSEVDILDDGYRWRKYGQKVVKGNPNPRSYYKCTNPGCTVRKHVERASHDLKSVITTYEGKHNHDVPAARSGNQSSSAQAGGGGGGRRPLQGLAGFDGPSLPPPPLGSYAPAGYPIVGQATMWALQHGNGWPGGYRAHEDPATAAGQFGGGAAAPLEGAWFREMQ